MSKTGLLANALAAAVIIRLVSCRGLVILTPRRSYRIPSSPAKLVTLDVRYASPIDHVCLQLYGVCGVIARVSGQGMPVRSVSLHGDPARVPFIGFPEAGIPEVGRDDLVVLITGRAVKTMAASEAMDRIGELSPLNHMGDEE